MALLIQPFGFRADHKLNSVAQYVPSGARARSAGTKESHLGWCQTLRP